MKDSICMQSELSSDLSDITEVFESVEMLSYYQAIKGFDKPDFHEVVSIEHR